MSSPKTRLEQILNILSPADALVKIGDVELLVEKPLNLELVPSIPYALYDGAQDFLGHLRWMIQKGNLGQDMFLIGAPGPLKRLLALSYAQLAQKEVEYVCLSRDVTDADLKQRREIKNGTATFLDQPCVRAAIHGRLLILDGVEKAERNVLPILNNLLENREMALEDGRFLVNPQRYDAVISGKASQGEIENSKLVRCSEKFLVIALGLPVPKYEGYPLDPPLRSRFQARLVDSLHFQSRLAHLIKSYPNAPTAVLERLLALGEVLNTTENDDDRPLPDFPATLDKIAGILAQFPALKSSALVEFCYPYFLLPTLDESSRVAIQTVMKRFELDQEDLGYVLESVQDQKDKKILLFRLQNKQVPISIASGPLATNQIPFFVATPYHASVLTKMIMAHATGDICIVGDKGSGKSILIRAFAGLLGYEMEFIPVYKDMSARILLQRRNTTDKGDTVWEMSGLVDAAIHGRLAILDPVDVLSFGTLSTLQRLVSDREAVLPDGTFLVHPTRYQRLKSQMSSEELLKKRVYPVHPGFRIIAVARPGSGQVKNSWLNPEIASMFSFVVLRSLSVQEELAIIQTLVPGINEQLITKTLQLANNLRMEKDDSMKSLASNISTRQLLRIARHLSLYPQDGLYESFQKISLYRFLPFATREAFDIYMRKHDIAPKPKVLENIQVEAVNGYLRIGDIQAQIETQTNPLLVPKITFFENQRQNLILQDVMKDFLLGEHLLLIGNQGVGKNKIIDYFLQRMNLPRQYIQLHRDSTVYNLTSNPVVRDGLLMYEDSPLVKAVREGYILVVDEADKAPTHVTSVLKSLIEDGEMVLSDGRRIVTKLNGPNQILIHPKFRMVVLANRPGFPFLGNDFYREIGDVFACHCVDNPDPDSELSLLKNYAPDVSEDILIKLIASFNDLRRLVEEGLINYPYSTRELVNAVRHLQRYPAEGLARALQNVFDFDAHEDDIRNILVETMNKNGIPTGMESSFKVDVQERVPLPKQILLQEWSLGQPAKARFQGKDLHLRGSWKLGMPQEWLTVEHTNGRAAVFSEWLYTFQLNKNGNPMDVVASLDGSLYGVSANPVVFHQFSKDHRKQRAIELYEYIPSHKGTKLSLFELFPSVLLIHNSQENNFLVLDLPKDLISVGSIEGLDPTIDSKPVSLGKAKILFYQRLSPHVTIVDFAQKTQRLIHFHLQVETVFSFGDQFLVALKGQGSVVYEVCDIQTQEMQPVIVTMQHKQGTILFGDVKYPDAILIHPSSFYARFQSNPMGLQLFSALKAPNDPVSNRFLNLEDAFGFLSQTKQVCRLIPSDEPGHIGGWIEIADTAQECFKRIAVPLHIPIASKMHRDLPASVTKPPILTSQGPVGKIVELQDGNLLMMDLTGRIMVFQSRHDEMMSQMQEWKRLTGALDAGTLSIIYNGRHPDMVESSQIQAFGEQGQGMGQGQGQGQGEGEGDGEGEGSGGAGGTGASGGGIGAPTPGEEGRQSGGIDGNFELRSSGQLAPAITDAQKELHELRMRKRLQDLQMTAKEMQQFTKYKQNVQREIRELRVILESVEAKSKERVWLKNKTAGDIDDAKLIEGLTGEKTIYKVRGENEDDFYQEKPKKMIFVFDLSASMMRFNGHDGRLDRSLECALMIMEAFKGFEHKFSYKICGHSGDGPQTDFLEKNKYPKNEKDIFTVLNKMMAHASYCMSGDTTLQAVTTAMKDVTKEEADDYFVVVLSDANLQQYNISTASIGQALKADPRVTAFMIFIGNLSSQAERLASGLPGNAFICLDNKDLPRIIQSMFVSSLLK
ncbi:AAA domain-containing protein [Gorgonomyces haynaldii]|nr:AAA domain-containing protein [Gorgonomyces haynaldii]